MWPVPTLSLQALGVKRVKPLLPQPGSVGGLGHLQFERPDVGVVTTDGVEDVRVVHDPGESALVGRRAIGAGSVAIGERRVAADPAILALTGHLCVLLPPKRPLSWAGVASGHHRARPQAMAASLHQQVRSRAWGER